MFLKFGKINCYEKKRCVIKKRKIEISVTVAIASFSFAYCLLKKPPLAELRNIKILQINVSPKTNAYVNKQQQTEEVLQKYHFFYQFFREF